MKKIIFMVILVAIAVGVWFCFFHNKEVVSPTVLSFQDCVAAGYTVTGTSPRQCKTPDSRTYAEELPAKITYNRATVDNITVELPFPGAVVGKTFTVTGKARGPWYFEASFPVEVRDKNGNILAQVPAQAQGDWMVTNFVPFKATISVPSSYIGPATLILRKDNASGLPENDASISFPITIEY